MTTPPPPDALAAAGAELVRVRAYENCEDETCWASDVWHYHHADADGAADVDLIAVVAHRPLARIRAEQTAEHDTNGVSDE